MDEVNLDDLGEEELRRRLAKLEAEKAQARDVSVALTPEEIVERDLKVKEAVKWSMIAAAVLALVLFGASSPFLIALELFLVWKIAEYHRFVLTPVDIFRLKGVFVILGGFIAAHIARFFVHFIPGANAAVAAGFVWGIGYYVPPYLEKQQKVRNETGWVPPEGGNMGCVTYGLIIGVVVVGLFGAVATCIGSVLALGGGF